nr:GntR family transcriptional regulator [Brevibacterium permense]
MFTHEAEPRHLVNYTHQRLRDAILTNELPSASSLSQVQLAKDLGVSRTPLREAVRLLEHEGLATVKVNKQVMVASVSPEDLDALYSLRIQQESLAIFETVRTTRKDRFTSTHEHLESMEAAVARHDFESWTNSHRNFHLSLVLGTNDRLNKSISQLFDHADRYRRIYLNDSDTNWAKSMEEHRQIHEASTSSQPARAAELLAEHYSHTACGVLQALDSEYEPTLTLGARTMAYSLRFLGMQAPTR